MELLKKPILRVPLVLALTGTLCRVLRFLVILVWTRMQIAQGPDPVSGAYELSVGPVSPFLDVLCFLLFWAAGWKFVRGLTRKQIFFSATIMVVWLGILLTWEQISQAVTGNYSLWVHRLYATQEAMSWATQLLIGIFDEVTVPVVLPSLLTPYLYLLLGRKTPQPAPPAADLPGEPSQV